MRRAVGGERDFAHAQVFERSGYFGGLHVGDLELAVEVDGATAERAALPDSAGDGRRKLFSRERTGSICGCAGCDDAHDRA
jgi:hypothetical protein